MWSVDKWLTKYFAPPSIMLRLCTCLCSAFGWNGSVRNPEVSIVYVKVCTGDAKPFRFTLRRLCFTPGVEN